MLLPALPTMKALQKAINNLAQEEASHLQGSLSYSVNVAMKALIQREKGGIAAVRTQIDKLQPVLDLIEDGTQQEPKLLKRAQQLKERAATIQAESNIQEIERSWRSLLEDTEKLIQSLQHTDMEPAKRSALCAAISHWEADDLASQVAVSDEKDGLADTDLTEQKLLHYLQDRFNDKELRVSGFRKLAGGFGKQTYLFSMTSKALSGDMVMRRDLPDPVFDNDCHRIHKEYVLLKAILAQGFPVPEMLWLDTEHALLPGGDFLVMERVAGNAGGNVFEAAAGEIPADLTQVLAEIMAALHCLPELAELDKLTDSISLARWNVSLTECTRQYLEDWFALFQHDPHLPSPAIVAQFQWLLNNIPEADGKPSLIHGDIGFHNFLFDQDKLTAVLDWEYGHLGDPAEDLAYVRNTIGNRLDWDSFIKAYVAAGGQEVDERRIQFFQVWGQVRNAASANLVTAKFALGRIQDMNMVCLPHELIPIFIREADRLIRQFDANHH